MKQAQKHSLTSIVTVKSVRFIVVAAMMAVAAVGGVNAEQIKLLDYKTGEMFFIDDSEMDKYKYTYSFTLDELGFTYEFDCRYAIIREWNDGEGTVSIEPVGISSTTINTIACCEGRIMKELLSKTGTKYRSVKHSLLETDYIELNPCRLGPRVRGCGSCGRPYELTHRHADATAEIVEYYYDIDREKRIRNASVLCHMLQYNLEEQIVRLYSHQKIRFDYSTEEYEKPTTTPLPSPYANAILFNYETGEMTEMDSERPDIPEEYKCHSEVTYDDAGFTFEYDARYAMIYPIEDLYFAWPCGMGDTPAIEINRFYAASENIKPVMTETEETRKCKGIKYDIIESDYIELTDFESASKQSCHNCFRNSGVSFIQFNTFRPSLVTATPYHDDLLHITSFLAGTVHCVVMQYNYEEKTLRLYKRLRIRFDYVKNAGFEEQSGVAEVEADGGGEAQYFNLQGMRVAQPRAGQLYIERRGNSGRLLRM